MTQENTRNQERVSIAKRLSEMKTEIAACVGQAEVLGPLDDRSLSGVMEYSRVEAKA